MNIATWQTGPTSARQNRDYRFIFLASYPLILVGELVVRLAKIGVRASDDRKSLLVAAREGAHRAATYAFLG
jgi:hypothetical protein